MSFSKAMADHDVSEPLLTRLRRHNDRDRSPMAQTWTDTQAGFATFIRNWRARSRNWLSSPGQHYSVMTIVTLDVSSILFNIFIQLIACDMHMTKENWVQRTTSGLEVIEFMFSSFFILELMVCLLSFGFSHLSCWFRLFDSLIIILTFAISVASQGPIRSIGSLVIVLRLWRLARISEETILGAAERIEGLQQRNQEMSDEIKELREQLGLTHTTDVDVESII